MSLTLYLRCKDFPQVDLSKWAKPKSDDETEMEKEPVVVACVWVTKAKAVDCSNLNWFVSAGLLQPTLFQPTFFKKITKILGPMMSLLHTLKLSKKRKNSQSLAKTLSSSLSQRPK